MADNLKLRRTSELPPAKPAKWLGIGWIPRSEITVLVGAEGIGKSLLWVRIAAAVTTGRPLPEMQIPQRNPATVAVIVSEDGRSEVEARLKLAGADMENILWFGPEEDGTGAPAFAGHDGGGPMRKLADDIRELDEPPAFLVVDAWLDTVDGGLQVKDGQQARAALAPWKKFATHFGTAVMLLTHTNRLTGASTRDRMGSTAVLRQKARMVLFADRPDDDLEHIYVGPDKANNTGILNALMFTKRVEQVRQRAVDDLGTSAVLDSPVDVGQTIQAEIRSWEEQQKQANRKPTKADQAAEAIRGLFESRGVDEIPTPDVDRHLKVLGFSDSAIRHGKPLAGESDGPRGLQGQWFFRLTPVSSTSTTTMTPLKTDKTDRTDSVPDAVCACGEPFVFAGFDSCPKCEVTA